MQKPIIIFNSSGSALVAAVAFAAVFSIIAVGTVRLTSHGSDMLKRDTEVIKTYWANEAGIRIALRYISQIDQLGAINEDFTAIDDAGSTVNGFTPNVTIASTATGPNTFSYAVTSNSNLPNSSITVKNNLGGVSLSTMQKWTYFEKNTGAVWIEMVVDGDYHTNGFINAGTDMDATKHVTGQTTTAGRINPGYTFDRPNFPDFYKKGIRRSEYGYYDNLLAENWLETRFPHYKHIGLIDTKPMEPDSFAGAYNITNSGRDIAIKIDGTGLDVFKKNNGGNWVADNGLQDISIESNPIIKTYSKTYVWGTLDGRLTIVSDGDESGGYDIYMGGNITYADTDLSTSNDVLALVSGNDFVIPNSFNCSPAGHSHSFKDNGGTVYGTLFAVNGDLLVSSKDNYSNLQDFNIIGGVFLKAGGGTYYNSGDYWNGWEWVPNLKGIKGIYTKDLRLINNTVCAPGIPFAREKDLELSVEGVVVFKNVLNPGVWENSLGS